MRGPRYVHNKGYDSISQYGNFDTYLLTEYGLNMGSGITLSPVLFILSMLGSPKATIIKSMLKSINIIITFG